jgi:hypothetical protein
MSRQAWPLLFVSCIALGCSAGGSEPDKMVGSNTGSGGTATGAAMAGSGGAGGNAGTGAGGTNSAGGSGGGGGNGGSGAVGGSGGALGGSGGQAGTGGMGGSSSTGSGVGCSGADIVCDDFEAASISAEFRATAQAMPVLSTMRAKSGSQSLLFAPEGQIGRFLTTAAPFPAGGELFMRVYMNFELATMQMSGHTGFLVGATQDSNGQELRLGQSQPGCNAINPQLDLNHIPTDKTMCSTGLVTGGNPGDFMNPGETLQANTWYCVETYWNTNEGEFRIWVDDRELEVLHADATSWCTPQQQQQQNCQAPVPWPIEFTQVKFGTQVYNGVVGNIWYDDVAYSTVRVGCE